MKKVFLLSLFCFILYGCIDTIPYKPSEEEKIRIEQRIKERYRQAEIEESSKTEYKHENAFSDKSYPKLTCKGTVNQYIRENVDCKDFELVNIQEKYRYAGIIRCDINIRCNSKKTGLFYTEEDDTRYGRISEIYWLSKDDKKDIISKEPPYLISKCFYTKNDFFGNPCYNTNTFKCPKDDSFAEFKKCLTQVDDSNKNNQEKDKALDKKLKELKESITNEENNTPARQAYEKNPETKINWFATLTAPIWVPLAIPVLLLAAIL